MLGDPLLPLLMVSVEFLRTMALCQNEGDARHHGGGARRTQPRTSCDNGPYLSSITVPER